MRIINTTEGISGFKMRIISRLIRSLPVHDDYAFSLMAVLRKHFGIEGNVYGRSDVDSIIGRDITDDEWTFIQSTSSWLELAEACEDISFVVDACAELEGWNTL